jgi:hypothetical protein
MNAPELDRLGFKAEVQRRVIDNCTKKMHEYFRSRKWEILSHKFRTLGYQLPNDLLSCKLCDDDAQGYYFYKQKKIVICANNVLDKDFDVNMTTQLISAFDDVRAEIDPSNGIHIACSVIRGVNLSGRCTRSGIFRYMKEYDGYYRCVREGAVERLIRNKNLVVKREEAEKLVLDVWDTCFYDYEPYTTEEFRKEL